MGFSMNVSDAEEIKKEVKEKPKKKTDKQVSLFNF